MCANNVIDDMFQLLALSVFNFIELLQCAIKGWPGGVLKNINVEYPSLNFKN